jgi:hypothetical protein
MIEPALPAGRKRKDRAVIEGKSVQILREALNSSATRAAYERRLVRFFHDVGFKADEFVAKAKTDSKWAQKFITDYMLKQKQRVLDKKIEASSLGNTRKPLRLLLEMNDVTDINWKRISRLMPKERKYALDRAPTLDELRLLISNSELRLQAVLLTMASSGIRIGAWDYLDWGHVESIKKSGEIVAAKLRVYAGDAEEYPTFITPEAYRKLEQYIKLRESHGEKITKDSPLIRDRWETVRGGYVGEVKKPLRLKSSGVKRLFEDALWKFGLRKEKKKRHEFSIHSLRKFFKTRAEQVMRPINVETLMGHSTGVSDSYYRPTEKELLEDYLKAVPLLTVSEAEEVRRESRLSRQQLEERLGQLEDLVSQLVSEKGEQAHARGRSHRADTSNERFSKKIVKADDIEKLMNEGWEPMMSLPDGRMVMKAA